MPPILDDFVSLRQKRTDKLGCQYNTVNRALGYYARTDDKVLLRCLDDDEELLVRVRSDVMQVHGQVSQRRLVKLIRQQVMGYSERQIGRILRQADAKLEAEMGEGS